MAKRDKKLPPCYAGLALDPIDCVLTVAAAGSYPKKVQKQAEVACPDACGIIVIDLLDLDREKLYRWLKENGVPTHDARVDLMRKLGDSLLEVMEGKGEDKDGKVE